jgi:effector-binding domain-containing protein
MDYEIVDLEPQLTAVVRGVHPIAELPGFFQRAYGELFHMLGRNGIAPIGEPIAFYPSEPSDVVEVEAGVVVDWEVEPDGEVCASTLPGGRVVTALHVGPYETLEQTYRALLADMEAAGLVQRTGGMWEQYLTDPDAEPDQSKWQTRIFLPIES